MYVTPEELSSAWHDAKSQGKVTNRLGACFLDIATGYSRRSWFVGYSFRQDMISSAVLDMVAGWKHFDPDRGTKIFSYFTTIAHRRFVKTMQAEREHANIRDALILDAGYSPGWNYESPGKGQTSDDTAFL